MGAVTQTGHPRRVRVAELLGLSALAFVLGGAVLALVYGPVDGVLFAMVLTMGGGFGYALYRLAVEGVSLPFSDRVLSGAAVGAFGLAVPFAGAFAPLGFAAGMAAFGVAVLVASVAYSNIARRRAVVD